MAERDHCPWCAGEASDPRACDCPHDCGIKGCMQSPKMPEVDAGEDGWDDEGCSHEHTEECYDEQGYASYCTHGHYCACGQCGCAGYCDDHVTYNLRPAETGGNPDA